MHDKAEIILVLFDFVGFNFCALHLLAFWIVLLQQFGFDSENAVYCSTFVWSILIVSPPIIERLYRCDKNWKALFTCGLSTIIWGCTIGSSQLHQCSLIAFSLFLAVHLVIGFLSLATPNTIEKITILIADLFRMIMSLIVTQKGFEMRNDDSFVPYKPNFWYDTAFCLVIWTFLGGFSYLFGLANLYPLGESLENREIPQFLDHVIIEARDKPIDLLSLKFEELNKALNHCEKLRRELEEMV